MTHRCSARCIIGPHTLEHIAKHGTPRQRAAAVDALSLDHARRLQRTLLARTQPRQLLASPAAAGPPTLQRTIRDARHTQLVGRVVRQEGDKDSKDVAVNEAYDGLGHTWQFYFDQFRRNSIDGHGMHLNATVHFDRDYDNAYYDEQQRRMFFGDGDRTLFHRFTIALDVIGHELTHGVTATTAGLLYEGQSGALNESMSDCMGATIRQVALGLKVDDPDGWLIGKGLLAEGVSGRALRDMAHPGTAYDDKVLGKDPQPAAMSGYVHTSQDNGGVHTNSGIPNRAYYLAAQNLGDTLKAARVWYETLRDDRVAQDCGFATWANVTIAQAVYVYSDDAGKAVKAAWQEVEVLPADVPALAEAA